MKNNFFRLSLIVSILLHVVLSILVWFQPQLFPTKAKEKKIVELELMDPKEFLRALNQQKNQGQIVEQHESINKEKPIDAKFLSKEDQRVEKETKAAVNDKFRNTPSMGGAAKPQPKLGETAPQEQPVKEKVEEPKKKFLTSEEGVKSLPSLKDLKPQFKIGPKHQDQEQAEGGGEGPSATDDHLNVATGMQTLLNTREFVYYSYYQRIKDKLRQYWEPKIKGKMERLMRQGRTIASSADRITKIVILLDNGGKLVKVQVISPSGVEDLDEAAVEAFEAAAPFPNPPKGIVEQDGLIRIRWDFILEANNSIIGTTHVASSR